jgi:RNA polymerase sigma-70 factor (ECF subfamily)
MNARNSAYSDGPSGSIGSTSSGLLDRARKSDPEAWRRIAEVYGSAIYDTARTAGLQEADAADVVQEVLVAVLKNLEGFRPTRSKGSFRSWLWTICRNNLRDRFRRGGRHVQTAGGSSAQAKLNGVAAPASYPSADQLMEAFEGSLMRGALESIRHEFAERSWQAFWLRASEGRKAADVAAELGMTEAAVNTAKSRVAKRLRQVLSDVRE